MLSRILKFGLLALVAACAGWVWLAGPNSLAASIRLLAFTLPASQNLVTAGVDRKDIATSNVTLQSQYGSDGTTVTGYQASNGFTVTVRDLSTASRVLAVITSTGGNATRLNSVNLSINDDSQLLRDARARAFNDAKDRAQQFADLSGLKLGNVLSISEVPGAAPPVAVPMPRGPMADAAVSAVPIEPGQQTVSFQVTAIWELV